ncbi:GNAT family N-acetyltransferase [Anaeromicropila herbilytica]|uniref:Spermidine acetyltransferase n=1 Tax=Anaeromicropila herbilytica TaxID=2785025 RepID=A0A7R7ICU8_9FIRM|nr:GNAT family N-acetyltransferase [Anaeromicropila herbilytica]BCN30907.1 spermidine acetyltransferase [Anaeromicropila herbilytica]
MESIKLIDITSENWVKVCFLHPGEEGAKYVASNPVSIVQSVYEKGWIIKGIEKDGTLIGFTMYGYSEELSAYELCRFMIDQQYQGMGYGKRALNIIINEMYRRFDCKEIYLSTGPSNNRGKHVYEQAGFVSTGTTCGDGDDIEDIFCLKR